MAVSSHGLSHLFSWSLGQTAVAGVMIGVVQLSFGLLLKQQMVHARDMWDWGFKWVAGAEVLRSLLVAQNEESAVSEEARARAPTVRLSGREGGHVGFKVCPAAKQRDYAVFSLCIFHILFSTASWDVRQAWPCFTVTWIPFFFSTCICTHPSEVFLDGFFFFFFLGIDFLVALLSVLLSHMVHRSLNSSY